MDFFHIDLPSAYPPFPQLASPNHTTPIDRFTTHRDGQLGYSPFTGQWHTSTLDWCEANYDISIFLANSWGITIWLAEWWNCWSNVPFVLLALWGAYSTSKLPNRMRYALAHLAIAGVGIGSFVFHATLNWYAQVLLDELPMIYASCQALYCILAKGQPTGGKGLMAFCMAFAVSITAIYLVYPNPIFHQVTFGSLQLFMAYHVYLLLIRLPPTTVNAAGPGANTLKRDAIRVLAEGVGLTVLAFVIWNLDNVFCNGITKWRNDEHVPYWVGVLSQGHAWWHILGAVGINRSVTGFTGVTIGVNEPNAYEYGYRLKLFPYVRPRYNNEIRQKDE